MSRHPRILRSPRLSDAIRAFRAARVELAAAIRSECPGQAVVSRGSVFVANGNSVVQRRAVAVLKAPPSEGPPA